jgi:hypothetical protein
MYIFLYTLFEFYIISKIYLIISFFLLTTYSLCSETQLISIETTAQSNMSHFSILINIEKTVVNERKSI